MPNFTMPSKRNIIIAAVALAVLIFAFIVIKDFLTPPDPKPAYVELDFWGVFDDEDVYRPLIEKFRQQFIYTNINYVRKNSNNFEDDLVKALAAGQGPDIVMIHHTWLPKVKELILPLDPQMTLSVESAGLMDLAVLNNFQNTYVDVVVDDFVADGSIWAMPLYVDSLALFYNKDIFNTVGITEPPATWQQFQKDVGKLRIKNEQEDILRAGAAIGTAYNINRSTDILSLLMMQHGAKMTNEQRTKATFNEKVASDGQNYYPGQGSLEFYTSFANAGTSFYTWNNRMNTHYSIDGFTEGSVAMMLSYAYQLPTIRAKTPYLNFGIAPMPQPETATLNVDYANYWGLATARSCQFNEQKEACDRAWEFILWLNQKENVASYLASVKRPAARKDLIKEQKNDLDLGVFAAQALTARSWYQVDNNAIETIMADMIESVVAGSSGAKEAINKAADQVSLLMK